MRPLDAGDRRPIPVSVYSYPLHIRHALLTIRKKHGMIYVGFRWKPTYLSQGDFLNKYGHVCKMPQAFGCGIHHENGERAETE